MARYTIDNRPAPIDFQAGDIVKRTVQNAKNLLMCQMGEVPYDRYRGFNPALYDLPLPDLQAELLPELDLVMANEPDVEVLEAEATLRDDGVYIRVVIDVTIAESGEGGETE